MAINATRKDVKLEYASPRSYGHILPSFSLYYIAICVEKGGAYIANSRYFRGEVWIP